MYPKYKRRERQLDLRGELKKVTFVGYFSNSCRFLHKILLLSNKIYTLRQVLLNYDKIMLFQPRQRLFSAAFEPHPELAVSQLLRVH